MPLLASVDATLVLSPVGAERTHARGQGREKLRCSVRCTYLEIYREELADLLRPRGPPLALRQDAARGAFVEGLEERDVFNCARPHARLPAVWIKSIRCHDFSISGPKLVHNMTMTSCPFCFVRWTSAGRPQVRTLWR